MTMLRKTVTLLTVIAVAGNSAAGSLRPCCCTERQPEPAHSCCEKAADVPQMERAACCASTASARPAASGLPAVGQPPCCCIKSLPATPQVREAVASRSLSPVEYEWVGDGLRLADFPPAKQRILRSKPGLFFPAAPSLCALYCIWLN